MMYRSASEMAKEMVKREMEAYRATSGSQQAARGSGPTSRQSRPRPAGSDSNEDGLSPPAAKKQKQNVNGEDLEDRHLLRDLSTTKEKINVLLNLRPKVPKTKQGKLTGGARKFFYRFMNPTLTCLEKCHGGNVDSFASKYPTYQHTTWECKDDSKN